MASNNGTSPGQMPHRLDEPVGAPAVQPTPNMQLTLTGLQPTTNSHNDEDQQLLQQCRATLRLINVLFSSEAILTLYAQYNSCPPSFPQNWDGHNEELYRRVLATYNDATRADLAICHHRNDDDINSLAYLSDFVPFDSTEQVRKQIVALNRDWNSHLAARRRVPARLVRPGTHGVRSRGARRRTGTRGLLLSLPADAPYHLPGCFVHTAAGSRFRLRQSRLISPLKQICATQNPKATGWAKACQEGEDGMTAVAHPVEL